jgi:hypothetical protein
MATLDEFLQATDLDALLSLRHELSPLTASDADRIESIIRDWDDYQQIANLLLHPSVMPAQCRFAAIDRALGSDDSPYLTLAAVVGLQSVDPLAVPAEHRSQLRNKLLRCIQSESETLAGRASVTMFRWFSESEAASVVSLYPIPDAEGLEPDFAGAAKFKADWKRKTQFIGFGLAAVGITYLALGFVMKRLPVVATSVGIPLQIGDWVVWTILYPSRAADSGPIIARIAVLVVLAATLIVILKQGQSRVSDGEVAT